MEDQSKHIIVIGSPIALRPETQTHKGNCYKSILMSCISWFLCVTHVLCNFRPICLVRREDFRPRLWMMACNFPPRFPSWCTQVHHMGRSSHQYHHDLPRPHHELGRLHGSSPDKGDLEMKRNCWVPNSQCRSERVGPQLAWGGSEGPGTFTTSG